MWRTALRGSVVLAPEWWDLDYAGDPAALLVRRSKTRKARTVRMRGEPVQFFTNWPSNRSPRCKMVDINTRTVLRHIAEVVVVSGCRRSRP